MPGKIIHGLFPVFFTVSLYTCICAYATAGGDANVDETAASRRRAFEWWDSSDSEPEDSDVVAMPTSKGPADNKQADSKEVFESWDSEPEDTDAVAVAMDKDSADVMEKSTPDNKPIVESWDSEDEEDMSNRCEKRIGKRNLLDVSSLLWELNHYHLFLSLSCMSCIKN